MNTNPKNPTEHVGHDRMDEVRRTAPPSGGDSWDATNPGGHRMKQCPFCGSLEIEKASLKAFVDRACCLVCKATGPYEESDIKANMAWNNRV